MIIGKQSTINDLQDLKVDLEEKIQDAKSFNFGTVSQIETAVIRQGSMLDHRPVGVYHFDATIAEAPLLGIEVANATDKNGVGLFMKTQDNTAFGAVIFTNWSGEAYVITKQNGLVNAPLRLLSTGNTITDSNGFIKAA